MGQYLPIQEVELKKNKTKYTSTENRIKSENINPTTPSMFGKKDRLLYGYPITSNSSI